jgi:hypothetical protein
MVQDVKQAHVKVPETQALHAELDRLFSDLKIWVRLLIECDEGLGASPLERMPSVAGRTPANLPPGSTTNEEVRRIVEAHLNELEHVAAGLEAQDDPQSQGTERSGCVRTRDR